MDTNEVKVDDMLVVRRNELKSEIDYLSFQIEVYAAAIAFYSKHNLNKKRAATNVRLKEFRERVETLSDEHDTLMYKIRMENYDVACAYGRGELETPVFSQIAQQPDGNKRLRKIVETMKKIYTEGEEPMPMFGVGEHLALEHTVDNILLGIPQGYYTSDEFDNRLTSNQIKLQERISNLCEQSVEIALVSDKHVDYDDKYKDRWDAVEAMGKPYQELFSETVRQFG